MGGKIFGFPWKNFATCKLKRVGKKCAKEGAKMIFNSSNFLKNLISKNQEYSPARQCYFLIPPPPPTPLILFGKLFVRAGFFGMEWDCHAVDINVGQRRSVASDRAFFLGRW
jgi:hypothetical protein